MKTFKYTTHIAIFALFSTMVATVFYLSELYKSIKEETIQTAENCLRRADFMEMIVRANDLYSMNDSVITLHNFDIVGKNTSNGQ